MGTLIDQPIPTLFQGVSRQPDLVRLPGQVEDADNVQFSVVTGGFEKRAGTIHQQQISALAADNVAVHGYDRDAFERYIIIVEDGNLRVFDVDGTERAVSFQTDAAYLNATDPNTSFSFVTIADFTFVVNKTVTVEMDPAKGVLNPEQMVDRTEGIAFGNLTGGGGLNAAFDGGTVEDTFTAATINGVSTATIGKDWGVGVERTVNGFRAWPRSPHGFISTGGSENVTITLEGSNDQVSWTSLGSTSFVDVGVAARQVRDIASPLAYRYHRIRLTGSVGNWGVAELQFFEEIPGVESDAGTENATLQGDRQDFDALPNSPAIDDVYRITGKDSDKFTAYYVRWNGSVWEEYVDPTIPNYFKSSTMPHQLVRQADGSFAFQEAEWEPRRVGDQELVPDPDFVGKTLSDIVFFRDRLALVSDEVIFFGQPGDFFNFWPDKVIDQLDSDPFGRRPSSNRVNILQFAVPFNRALFSTSDKEQFEVSSPDSFTPRTASALEKATSYKASAQARPLVLGDVLYFAADDERKALIFEYFYDETTLSTTAVDVTNHVEGYVPGKVVTMDGDPATGTIAILSDQERSAIYVYRVYWQGDEKVMSSWSRWSLSGIVPSSVSILGMHFLGGLLYIVAKRGSDYFLESLSLNNEFSSENDSFLITASDGMKWPIRLDRRASVTGTYDAGTDLTSWTLPYPHEDSVEGVTDTGRKLALTFPSALVATSPGDLSATPVVFGKPYRKRVKLSKQYVRDNNGQGATITTGRLQLKRLLLDYVNSGYFEAQITPEQRDTRTYAFTGRNLGDPLNVIGSAPIVPSGQMRVPVNSRGDTVAIEIVNDTHLPSTITSARWIGFYNEITRQE